MRTSVASTRSKVKVKVTELPKLRRVHFSRSIFSAVLAWSSKLIVDGHSMGPELQLVGARLLNFLLGKLSREFKLRPMSIFLEIQTAIFRYCVMLLHSHMVGQTGSPTYTVYVDMTLTRSKVKIKVTEHLNFRQLAKPCMLAAMTAAPLRGFLDFWSVAVPYVLVD